MTSVSDQPLTDEEFDRLALMLASLGGENAMNVETLDGFLCAVIVGPEVVMPTECLTPILGREPDFETQSEVASFLDLLMRHWNTIACAIDEPPDYVYLPVMMEGDEGVAPGNDWAKGFLRGVAMREDAWREFILSDEYGGPMVPIFALAYEHHPEPAMRPYREPVSAELREELHQGAAAALIAIRRYFRANPPSRAVRSPQRRSEPKVGRNDPCPCGSGRKFKQCHGRAGLH